MKSIKMFIFLPLLLTGIHSHAETILGSSQDDKVLVSFLGQNTNADAIIDGLNQYGTIPIKAPTWPASLNTNKAWIIDATGSNDAAQRRAASIQYCQTNIAVGETAYVFPGGYSGTWTNKNAVLYCAEGAQVNVGATNGTITVRGRGTVRALQGNLGYYDIECYTFTGFNNALQTTCSVHCVNATLECAFSGGRSNCYNINASDTIFTSIHYGDWGYGLNAQIKLKAHKVVLFDWTGTEENGENTPMMLCGDCWIFTDLLVCDSSGTVPPASHPPEETWIGHIDDASLTLQAGYVDTGGNGIHFEIPVKLLNSPSFDVAPNFGTTHSGTYQVQ